MTDQIPRRIAWFAPWSWTRRWKIAGSLLLLLPAPVYALSIGPAVMLVGAGYINADTATDIYRPLFGLKEEMSPQCADLLLKYMRLWDDRAGKLVYLSDELAREVETCRRFD